MYYYYYYYGVKRLGGVKRLAPPTFSPGLRRIDNRRPPHNAYRLDLCPT